MNEFKEFGTFTYKQELRDRFRSGDLVEQWANQYPQLFDEKTISHARNQAEFGFHFVEWLSAILVWHSTGYLSLGGYFYPSRTKQNEVLHKLLPKPECKLIENCMEYHSQPPDWLFYAPDYTDWFFCEIKGPGDQLKNTQKKYFSKIAEVTGKEIYLLTLEDM